MPHLSTSESLVLWFAQLLSATFLAILFLQSSIDKLVDRQGNLDYLIEHFSKSPLAGTVRPMFVVITLLELSAGLLCGAGVVCLLLRLPYPLAFWGATVAGVALTALFFGQRVAKDYAGAATLVPYFLLALITMYVNAF